MPQPPLDSLTATMELPSRCFPKALVHTGQNWGREILKILISNQEGISSGQLIKEAQEAIGFESFSTDEQGQWRIVAGLLLCILQDGGHVIVDRECKYVPQSSCAM